MTMQPQEPDHKEHPVLSVCLEDFEDELGNCSDYDAEEAQANLETAKNMTPEEWGYLAGLIADYLWTDSFSETWQDARIHAIERIRKARLGTDGPL